jgi:small GTP-binding protein
VQKQFVSDYDPTIEDSYQISTYIEGSLSILDILDTSGQEEYSAMQDQYWRTGEGFVCVYAVNDYNSFELLGSYMEKIRRIKDAKDTPMIIVGNKIDLLRQRVVGKSLAKTAEGVNKVFCNVVHEIRLWKQSQVPSLREKDHVKVCCQLL